LYPSAYPPRIRASILKSKNGQKTGRKFAAISEIEVSGFYLLATHSLAKLRYSVKRPSASVNMYALFASPG
jgi:hypothetical protein